MEWTSLLSSQRHGQKPTINFEPSRSAFEQDYDRIIFSHPFRRLQDKTQVHPLPEHDFVHTRLTHSLEVSSVGRSLGKRIGEFILQQHTELHEKISVHDFGAIVAAASLAHDLGNPPFGHAGEDAISDFFQGHPTGLSFKDKVSAEQWSDLVQFEGNAQGFRILNKNQYGLKLTYGTLGAFTKYPCQAHFPTRDKKKRSQKKFGFFQSEKQLFEDVAQSLQLSGSSLIGWNRHPLAFLVEAADDICYSIIDLEDGCSLGLVNYADAEVLLEGVISKNRDKLGKVKQLSSVNERIGYLRALAISDLTDECTNVFKENEQNILNATFDKALADECGSKKALDEIIKVSIEKIYQARKVVEIEAAGHEVLPGLLEEFTIAGMYLMDKNSSRKYSNLQKLLPEDIHLAIQTENQTHYGMLRLIIDFVSGMTDKNAISMFRRIKGMSI